MRAIALPALGKMVGHKTEAIYRRYAIADESMLREGPANWRRSSRPSGAPHRVVVPPRTGKVSAKSAVMRCRWSR
jgi:hypothetical protein